MKYLITGGCGFVGSNIASTLLQQDSGDVVLFDSLSREGAGANLEWLRSLGSPEFVHGDIRNAADVEGTIRGGRFEVIFHLAGQVAMTTSMRNPRRDYEVNVTGSFNVLEAVRQYSSDTAVVYSSSNKVYGNLTHARLQEEQLRYSTPEFPKGFDETAPLDFHTPYGCSKGAADQYMLDYARCYGLRTAVFRHSTIYGSRQFATFDQGWVGWFCQQALATLSHPKRAPFTIAGDGKQVRDLLFVEDAVRAYLAAADRMDAVRGQAFNIGGGMENSSSLLELFAFLEETLKVKLSYSRLEWRQDDQKLFVADNSKATALLSWKPEINKSEGVRRTLQWSQVRSE